MSFHNPELAAQMLLGGYEGNRFFQYPLSEVTIKLKNQVFGPFKVEAQYSNYAERQISEWNIEHQVDMALLGKAIIEAINENNEDVGIVEDSEEFILAMGRVYLEQEIKYAQASRVNTDWLDRPDWDDQ